MSFKINCPHCAKTLNVTEPAFGKTVSCPGCKQAITVPHPAQASRQASHAGSLPPWSGAAQAAMRCRIQPDRCRRGCRPCPMMGRRRSLQAIPIHLLFLNPSPPPLPRLLKR